MSRQITLFVLILLLAAPVAYAAEPTDKPAASKKKRTTRNLSDNSPGDLKKRLNALENTVEKLDAEMDVIRAQHKMMIHRTNLGFLDQLYLKAGAILLLPRSRTFPFRTDTGLGAYVGVGQYFGRNHVLDLALEWDLYPSFTLKYRFEIHSESPLITWGPVIGAKIRVADMKPFDNFLDRPEELKTSYYMFGGILGFPFGRSLFALEFLYMVNSHAFLVTTAGFHFFF